MRLIKLTKNKFAVVDDEDYENLSKHKWYASEIKGTWYAFRGIRLPRHSDEKGVYGKVIVVAMHREITNCPTGLVVDHLDGNGLNNQKANLNVCTQKENLNSYRKPYGHKTKPFEVGGKDYMKMLIKKEGYIWTGVRYIKQCK